MVYKGFDVGSAKPKKEILKKYPHKLVDIITAENIYTASNFIFDAKELRHPIVEELFEEIEYLPFEEFQKLL